MVCMGVSNYYDWTPRLYVELELPKQGCCGWALLFDGKVLGKSVMFGWCRTVILVHQIFFVAKYDYNSNK